MKRDPRVDPYPGDELRMPDWRQTLIVVQVNATGVLYRKWGGGRYWSCDLPSWRISCRNAIVTKRAETEEEKALRKGSEMGVLTCRR